MPSGYQAQFLERVAVRTFHDLLDTWIGPDFPGPSRLEPDLQKIDVTHQMPALSGDIGMIPFSWQIKARSAAPREVTSDLVHARAYRLHLERHYVTELAEMSRQTSSLYLALAIVDGLGGTPIAERPPTKRFRWYIVDLKQYCSQFDRQQTPAYVDIPVQNRLNLALFSLLWSAKWVKAYFEPLHLHIVDSPQAIVSLLKSFATELTDLRGQTGILLGDAVPELPRLADVLNPETYHTYAARLAIVGSLRNITAMLLESSGAHRIETYSPEALAGCVNLWLFSRTYHEFMRATQIRGNYNKRLLPFAHSTLDEVPRFFLAALYNVRRLYGTLNAEVAIVQMLGEDGRQDHSYWSDALRAFQWVEVDADGYVRLSESHISATSNDLEFLHDAEGQVVAAHGLSLLRGGTFGGLAYPDLCLESVRPACLFPEEDIFLEHPIELWSASSLSMDV
jgi:hypothetical protein